MGATIPSSSSGVRGAYSSGAAAGVAVCALAPMGFVVRIRRKLISTATIFFE
jgi:hypothetical protein